MEMIYLKSTHIVTNWKFIRTSCFSDIAYSIDKQSLKA